MQELFYGNNHLTCNNNVVTIELNGGAIMEKTATLNLRVNPITKQKAETVLKQLGIPMSVAMEMYLNQIAMVGGIPFSVTLPKVPESINADLMSDYELEMKLRQGVLDAENGNYTDAEKAFQLKRSQR